MILIIKIMNILIRDINKVIIKFIEICMCGGFKTSQDSLLIFVILKSLMN